jgi:hypothetical protein
VTGALGAVLLGGGAWLPWQDEPAQPQSQSELERGGNARRDPAAPNEPSWGVGFNATPQGATMTVAGQF